MNIKYFDADGSIQKAVLDSIGLFAPKFLCYNCHEDLTEKVKEMVISTKAMLLPKIAPLKDQAKKVGVRLEAEIESLDVTITCPKCGAKNHYDL